MLKVLVTGSRNWTDVESIRRDLSGFPADTLIIHGAARGADSIANRVAKEYGYSIARFPARWKKDGRKAAGPIRNSRMLEIAQPTMCFAYPLQGGSGTQDMMRKCLAAGVIVMTPDKATVPV
jgi:hypothetical protein